MTPGVLVPAAAIALLSLATPALAQLKVGTSDPDEEFYGPPLDVALDALIANPGLSGGRPVRTSGRLDVTHGSRYLLRDEDRNALRLVPADTLASKFQMAAREWLGRRVEVTGILSGPGGTLHPDAAADVLTLTFYRYTGPPDEEARGRSADAAEVSLESLVTAPGKRDGQLVRVTGMFRGANLYGDLPRDSRARRGDWVIKDGVYAIWITGRRPRGEGFALDASSRGDSDRWVEVVGRVETRNGVTILDGLRVTLTSAPSPPAAAAAPSPLPAKSMVAPRIVFTLPMDGDTEVPLDSRFIVQFSKDMVDASFYDRVVLRYAGAPQPGDRAFDGLVLEYDGARRALTVDPGGRLRPNRAVELVLSPGILDTDGLALVPRAASAATDAAEILRYRTALGP